MQNSDCDSLPFTLTSSRTLVVGVVNVTPDSFSNDGVYDAPEQAAERAAAMVDAGADIIDIGGESTRPGHTPISASEELRRLIPAVRTVAQRVHVPISVDTSKAFVACEALACGATIVNDVSGLRDPDILPVVAAASASLILVHWGNQVHGRRMDRVVSELTGLADSAIAAGIGPERLAVDPGLGMGKDWRANLEVLHDLAQLRSLQLPILVGPSRKGMIGRVLGVPPDDRLEGTAALIATAIAQGADLVRVHDVPYMSRIVRMMDALVRPRDVIPACGPVPPPSTLPVPD